VECRGRSASTEGDAAGAAETKNRDLGRSESNVLKPAKKIADEDVFVARAREGDKEAYRHLVEGYQDRLFGLVFSMVPNPEQAEDLTQEIFVKAFFALPRFAGDSAFYTWLFRIGSNHCLDHLRKRHRSEVSLDAAIEDENESAHIHRLPAPEQEEPDHLVEVPTESGEVLSSLTPDQRLILTLRELEGYSYEELADVMKCRVNTIKSRLNRAREALKVAFMGKYGNISTVKTVKNEQEDPQ
jgi:RNA polymerase sigma-70 factor, ECF subfamily